MRLDYLLKKLNDGWDGLNNLSVWTKVLIVVILVLIVVKKRNKCPRTYEGFGNKDEFTLKQGGEVYDGFYANIYDSLVYTHKKNEFEIGTLQKTANAGEKSIILDIGSGTGHHVEQMREMGIVSATGVDNSKAMVEKSKELYPKNKYVYGDALQGSLFRERQFTHITCFYFTIYYFKDKHTFFKNCFHWLMPGGRLIVHLVDKTMFDPILPPANPLLMLTPQRYADKRITQSTITFDEFKYNANFEVVNDTAQFVEKFTTRDSKKVFRKNKHEMFMEDIGAIVSLAEKSGFILVEKMDMIKAEYEYQYLYVFQRPE